MKCVLFAALCAVQAASVSSQGVSQKCIGIAALASEVMQGRQRGVPLSKMLEVSVATNNPVFAQMVADAYKRPVMEKPQNKVLAVSTYSELWYIKCVRIMG